MVAWPSAAEITQSAITVLAARKLNAHRRIVLHQDALDPGFESDLSAQLGDLLLDQPDQRLRSADAVSGVARIHPGQGKNHRDGRHLSYIADAEEAPQQRIGEALAILLAAHLRQFAEKRKDRQIPQHVQPVVRQASGGIEHFELAAGCEWSG